MDSALYGADFFPNYLDSGSGSTAFGGVSAAFSSTHDSISSNPAGLIYLSKNSVLGGDWIIYPKDSQRWSISVVDGSSDIIGGFNYSLTDFADARRHLINVALAYQLPYVAVGATAQSMHFDGLQQENGWHFTNSIGVLIPVAVGFTIGAISKSPLDLEENTVLPPSVHLGVMYSRPQSMRIGFDADRRFETSDLWNYSLGGEIMLWEFLSARGGYRWDHAEDFSYWTTGLSLTAPRIEISGFYLNKVSNPSGHGFGGDLLLRF